MDNKVEKADDSHFGDYFGRWWAICFLFLLLATWSLWWEGSISLLGLKSPSSCLSKVPLFSEFSLPSVLSNSLFSLALLCLLVLVIFPRWFSVAAPMVIFSTGLLSVADQSRLQAWWIVFAITTAARFVSRDWKDTRWQIGVMIPTIYFFSGFSKLDYQFVNSLGPTLIRSLLEPITNEIPSTLSESLPWLSFLFPISEILVAALLLFRRTKFVAAWAAIFMHCSLILALGPVGLQNQYGVLIWNVFFIGLVALTFFLSIKTESNRAPERLPSFQRIIRPIPVACVALGIGGIVGWVDPWPAWELYSSNSGRIEFWAPEQLTKGYPLVKDPSGKVRRNPQNLVHVDLKELTLKETGTPLYPHVRVQLGVAIGFAKKHQLNRNAVFVLKSKSNRFSGSRTIHKLNGLDSAKRFASNSWINGLPKD